jgi:hypothetical protein
MLSVRTFVVHVRGALPNTRSDSFRGCRFFLSLLPRLCLRLCSSIS